jgi:hypothetical protein
VGGDAAVDGLLFLDPEVRAQTAQDRRRAVGRGRLISTLYLMFLAVSIIDFCLSFTGCRCSCRSTCCRG